MEKRVLIAVLLSFLVLYVYQVMVPPAPDKKPAQASKTATAPNASAPEASNPAPSVQGASTAPATPASTPTPASVPTVDATPAREIVVDTPTVHAVFTTRGAVLKSWQLKNYHDEHGRALELVAGHAPADAPLPFTIATDDASVSAQLAAASFTVSRESGGGGAAWHAQFDADVSGVHAQKIFTIDPAKPYVVVVSASITRNGQPQPTTIRWGPALGGGIVVKSRTYNPPPQPVFFKDGKVTRITPAKIAQQPGVDGPFGFAGVDEHYFLTAVVKPSDSPHAEFAALDVPATGVTFDGSAVDAYHYVSWSIRYPSPPGAQRFFAGPKDFDILKSVDGDLVRTIDFGMFAVIVVPLLQALKWINQYVGNYGWSLILLTVAINLAMFPLRQKSVTSMRKMQEIQPEVKAIQDRYKNLKMSDPARAKMNTELMELYKQRGVNPASGCVPMLLTLPVLFAFYSMLSVAIELRGAPFIWWIHDLSARDPYYVFPLLMGATMFIQQKMTPTGAVDPTQQRMMMIVMPVMMTFMFLWAASGLVIYWTVSNAWGIAQQVITNRIIGAPVPRTIRPPAERQLKNLKPAGGGKTNQAKERES
jgi:YidC/Oxa1 family membrane protein insertase